MMEYLENGGIPASNTYDNSLLLHYQSNIKRGGKWADSSGDKCLGGKFLEVKT